MELSLYTFKTSSNYFWKHQLKHTFRGHVKHKQTRNALRIVKIDLLGGFNLRIKFGHPQNTYKFKIFPLGAK